MRNTDMCLEKLGLLIGCGIAATFWGTNNLLSHTGSASECSELNLACMDPTYMPRFYPYCDLQAGIQSNPQD